MPPATWMTLESYFPTTAPFASLTVTTGARPNTLGIMPRFAEAVLTAGETFPVEGFVPPVEGEPGLALPAPGLPMVGIGVLPPENTGGIIDAEGVVVGLLKM